MGQYQSQESEPVEHVRATVADEWHLLQTTDGPRIIKFYRPLMMPPTDTQVPIRQEGRYGSYSVRGRLHNDDRTIEGILHSSGRRVQSSDSPLPLGPRLRY